MIEGAGTDIRVACVQMEPRVEEPDTNVDRSLDFCRQAAGQGATIIVLPELCNSGYVFQSRDEAFAASEVIGEGPASEAWADFCRDNDTYVVAGIAERDGDKLFNSSVLVGPTGVIGKFRKVHLWNHENLYFEPGDLGFPVFSTPIGRIATTICYDGWFPESFRACALGGADIVCIPTNWVPIPGQARDQRAMATILMQANAHSNSIYIAAADRVGTERGQEFIGQSVIVSYTGWPLAGPASAVEEELVIASLDLGAARTARAWNAFNHPLRDRRPEAYI